MIPDLLDDLADRVMGRFHGKYRGEVTGTDDPQKMGRLKVRVQAVLGDLELWAMPCVPYAGPSVGFHALPGTGAGVWVEFEGGDPTYPIWVGCYWRAGELPAEASSAKVRLWRTEKTTLRLDDDADSVEIANTQQASLTLDAAVTGQAGAGKLEIAAAGVTASAGGAGKVEVTPATVSVNGGALEVT